MKERFENRNQAFDWLVEEGYTVAKGKFYADCKKGFPTIASDKTISKYQVLKYITDLNNNQTPANYDKLGSAENIHRKGKADAEIAERKAKRMAREDDENWLHAEEAWAVVAALINQIRNAARHQLYTNRREIIYTAKGNQDRDDEVYAMLEGLIDAAMNEVAGKSISISF